MSFKRHIQSCWRAFSFFIIVGLLSWPGIATAQQTAPDCVAADLDVSYRFLNSPPTETVVLTFKNTSQRACVLRPGAGIGFGDARQGHGIVTTVCANCDANGKPQAMDSITIAPEGTAYATASWETKTIDGKACQEGGTLRFDINADGQGYGVWSAELLADVCSVVRLNSYLIGEFPELPEAKEAAEKLSNVIIKMTPSGEVFYANDSFWLDVEINDPDKVLSLNKDSCPGMFIKTRASDGASYFNPTERSCQVTEGEGGMGRLIRTRISTMGRIGFSPQETRVEVVALGSEPHAPEVLTLHSNAIVLRSVNPATMERKWGPEVKGLAISLFLDKQNYLVGEDIPLRLAVENFSAAEPIRTGELPCWAGFSFEVLDANGQKVTSNQLSSCTGHGWFQEYPLGKVIPVPELTLSGLRRLPSKAGVYTVRATWQVNASDGEPWDSERVATTPPKVYAVVASFPITFEVVAEQP